MINLTESRDPKLLKQLRTEAMHALVEMARWQFAGHAAFARRLLGRIGGIEEARLDTLVERNDLAEAIIAAAQKSHWPDTTRIGAKTAECAQITEVS